MGKIFHAEMSGQNCLGGCLNPHVSSVAVVICATKVNTHTHTHTHTHSQTDRHLLTGYIPSTES